jgi:hypothetical protein
MTADKIISYHDLPTKDRNRMKQEFNLTLICDTDTLVSNPEPRSSKQKKPISYGAKVMAGILLNGYHNTEENLCFPGLDTIAELMSVSRRTVKLYIAELIEAGYIMRKQQIIFKNQYGRCYSWFNWNKINERREITNKKLNRNAVKGINGKLVNPEWERRQQPAKTEKELKLEPLAKPEEITSTECRIPHDRVQVSASTECRIPQVPSAGFRKDECRNLPTNNRIDNNRKEDQENITTEKVKRPTVAVDSFDNFSDEDAIRMFSDNFGENQANTQQNQPIEDDDDKIPEEWKKLLIDAGLS